MKKGTLLLLIGTRSASLKHAVCSKTSLSPCLSNCAAVGVSLQGQTKAWNRGLCGYKITASESINDLVWRIDLFLLLLMGIFLCHLQSQGSFTVLLCCRHWGCCCCNPSSAHTTTCTIGQHKQHWASLKSLPLMIKIKLPAYVSLFFLLISVRIMICKSHFSDDLKTVKLSVCVIENVSSPRQKWCSCPAWHQIDGLCLAADNDTIHIAIFFPPFLFFCSPRLSKLPGWVLKDGSTFLDKVLYCWSEFSCHAKSYLKG